MTFEAFIEPSNVTISGVVWPALGALPPALVLLAQVQPLHDHPVLVRQHPQHFAALAPVFAGDHLNRYRPS